MKWQQISLMNAEHGGNRIVACKEIKYG